MQGDLKEKRIDDIIKAVQEHPADVASLEIKSKIHAPIITMISNNKICLNVMGTQCLQLRNLWKGGISVVVLCPCKL